MENEVKKHGDNKPDVGGAIFLILLGIVFLLNTTGIVSWSVWGGLAMVFVKIWPIFLIIVGLQIIFGKRFISGILFSSIWILIFVIGLFFGFIFYTDETDFTRSVKNNMPWIEKFFLPGTELNNTIQSEDLSKFDSKEYSINLTSGSFSISDNSELEKSLKVTSNFYENWGVPSIKESISGGINKVNFQQLFNDNRLILNSRLNYIFELGKVKLPSSIKLNLTAGDGELAIDDTTISLFELNMTAGTMDANFQNDSIPQEIDINLTAGNLTLTIKGDVRVEITNKSIAGDLNVDRNPISKSGSYVINENGSKKVKIKINQTAGDIEIYTK